MIEEIFGVTIATFLGAFLVGIIFIGIAIYVYTALALMTVADRIKQPNSWLAWIPIANIALILQMGGFHWAWIFLILLPGIGGLIVMILTLVSLYKVAEKINVIPAWTTFLTIIPGLGNIWGLVLIGILAWKK